jgi:hypothetical protein
MVSHAISVQGVNLNTGLSQTLPALLKVNNDDFPGRFLTDLSSLGTAPIVTAALNTSPTSPVTLFQPVQRIVHLALLELTCATPGTPRLDPTRVDSAGVVVRRIPRSQNGVDDFTSSSAWMKSANGQLEWTLLNKLQECADTDGAGSRDRANRKLEPCLRRPSRGLQCGGIDPRLRRDSHRELRDHHQFTATPELRSASDSQKPANAP